MRKELDLIYGPGFGRSGYDVMKRCCGRSPVETEFVGAQCLSLEILGRKRCQITFGEWNTLSEDLVCAGGLPNGVLLRYEIDSSRYLE